MFDRFVLQRTAVKQIISMRFEHIAPLWNALSYFYFDLIWLSTYRNYFSDETTLSLCLSLFSLMCFSFPKGMYLTMGTSHLLVSLRKTTEQKVSSTSMFKEKAGVNLLFSYCQHFQWRPKPTVCLLDLWEFERSQVNTRLHAIRQIKHLHPEPRVVQTSQCHESSCLTCSSTNSWSTC